MEATPSLACANKCVFCWRHHDNPVGTSFRWEVDDPHELVEGFEREHLKMVKSLRLLRFFKLTKLLKLGDLATSVDRDTLDALEDFLEQGMTRSLFLVTTLALYGACFFHAFNLNILNNKPR